MRKTSLTIDPRIISHLGELLITDEKIALLELIKNSSDADALNCDIVIDTLELSEYGQGKIIIEDNGNGMNPYIIENGFLRIATSFKNKHQKISPIYNRIALGSKGIGRLALNQLGTYIEVETKLNLDILDYISDLEETFGTGDKEEIIKENEKFYYTFSIDWRLFGNSRLKLEEIEIGIKKNLANERTFLKKKHGTKITVYGLKGIGYWEHKNTKKNIEKDVLSFMNPFLDLKSNFIVKIDLNRDIIKSDLFDKERIKKMSDVVTIFDYKSDSRKLSFTIHRSSQYIRFLVDSLVKRMEDLEFECVEPIDYDAIYSKFRDHTPSLSLTRENLSKDYPVSDIKTLYTDDFDNFYLPGDFEGTLFGFYRRYRGVDSKTEVTKLLNNISGVMLFRNNFRIFPYGELDWLKLGTTARTKIINIYTPENTIGYVYIDGKENLEKLKELTNREGLVQDEYGKNFLTLMQEVVAKVAAYEDNRLRDTINIAPKQREKVQNGEIISFGYGNIKFKKKDNAKEIIERSIEGKSTLAARRVTDLNEFITTAEGKKELEVVTKKLTEDILEIRTVLKEFDQEKEKNEIQIEMEREYLQQFYPIIGATIVAETLSHEITRLSNNIKSSSLQIRKLINSKNENTQEKISKYLSLIDSNTRFLSRYASMLDVNSYSKRRKYELIDLKESLVSTLQESPLLEYKNISVTLNIIGDGFYRKVVKEGINIIFENLVINSAYWLEKMRIEDPTINIEFICDKEKIHIWDNGFGIHPNIAEDLFEPFKSNKPLDEGRGMGLFIVRELMKEVEGDIILLLDKNHNENRYKFEISFQGE